MSMAKYSYKQEEGKYLIYNLKNGLLRGDIEKNAIKM
jgi:hypothetical protein